MTLTNPEAIMLLKKARCYDVEESVDEYPEDERDGRDDFQFIADEASYRLSCYYEDGHCDNEYRLEAMEILRKTKYGKYIPISLRTFKPIYKEYEIREAKDFLNMIARTKRLVERLEKKGYTGKWIGWC